jgi:hypothetical protein
MKQNHSQQLGNGLAGIQGSKIQIPNGVVRINESEIELLPDRCVALLKEEKSQPKFYFVEKREADYLYSNDKKN